MKLTPLVLTVSLAANLALVALIVLRRPEQVSRGTSPSSPASAGSSSLAAKAEPGISALYAALAKGDPAALEAAGVSAEVARDLALGRAIRRAVDRNIAAQANQAKDGRWWRSNANRRNREEEMRSRRELSDALVAAFGFDPLFSAPAARFDFLSPEKFAALRQITQDYDEMMAKFSASGIQLPSDRERRQLLLAERERDIAALLSADELAEYEMRTSSSSTTLRSRFGDAIETEEDFRALYALQKAFDEKFPRGSNRMPPETVRARAEAEKQLYADMRAALGEEKFAALRRATDRDLRTLDALATRLNLPPAAADRVVATREVYAAESQRINGDSTLSFQDRRARIQELAQRAKAEVAQTLGSEAAETYAQRSTWLNYLQSGRAYSTSPDDSPAGASLSLNGQSVFPVPPAGASPVNARQVPISAGGAIVLDGPGITTPLRNSPPFDHIEVTSVASPYIANTASPVAGLSATFTTGAATPAPAQPAPTVAPPAAEQPKQ